MNKIVDMKLLWPNLYNKIKDEKWFEGITKYYYTSVFDFQGDDDYKSRPIIKVSNIWKDNKDEEVKIILDNAKSPIDPEWWITPHDCYNINGFFLYLVMIYSNYKVEIYCGNNHVFLKDNKGNIYDLYWQPLSIINEKEYKEAKKILPLELWGDCDMLNYMKEDDNINFIFKELYL